MVIDAAVHFVSRGLLAYVVINKGRNCGVTNPEIFKYLDLRDAYQRHKGKRPEGALDVWYRFVATAMQDVISMPSLPFCR